MNLLKFRGADLPPRQWLSFTMIFTCLELVVAFSSLGYIAIPPISLTTLHILVIIAAMLLGPVAGGLVGFAFGITSMWQAAAAGGVSYLDLLFSPWDSPDPFASFMLAVGTRVLFGIMAGLLFNMLFYYFHKFKASILKKRLAVILLTAFCYCLHTFLVLMCMWWFFPETGIDFFTVIASLRGINSLVNLPVTALLVFLVYLYASNRKNIQLFNSLNKVDYSKAKHYRMRYYLAIVFFTLVILALIVHMNIRVEEIYASENMVLNSKISNVFHHVLWQYLVAFDAAIIVMLELSFWATVYYSQKMDEMKSMEERIQLEVDANRIQTQMMHAMAHDIRTPLNAILGFTHLISQNLNNKKLSKEYLKKINVSGNFLMNLVTDLLELSKMRSGKMNLNPTECNIIKAFHDVEDIIRGQTQDKKQTLIFDLNVMNQQVSMDIMRMNQILLNLLGNAVKFTPEGGTITVTLRQIDGSEFEIRVKDTGIGMSKEFAARVFEPFVREEAVVKEIQGTGLGMSIVKNIVDAMAGDIKVESERGKGTEYIINLKIPILEMAFYESHESITNDDTAQCNVCAKVFKGKHILLVEDNEMNQEIAAELLSAIDLVVDVAPNGKVALEKVMAWPEFYDAILMDVNMPVMGGYEATRAIRNIDNEAAKNVPIFAMSGDSSPEDFEKARNAGMNNNIAKPIDMQDLMNKLGAVLTDPVAKPEPIYPVQE